MEANKRFYRILDQRMSKSNKEVSRLYKLRTEENYDEITERIENLDRNWSYDAMWQEELGERKWIVHDDYLPVYEERLQ